MSAIAAPSTRRSGFRFRRRWIGDVVAHGYIWFWLAIFALPFVATTIHSLELPEGGYGFEAYRFAFGSFKYDLLTSFKVTVTGQVRRCASVP